uniref:Nuclear pore complex protein nup54-like n=1 Tax=Petromyzon marinus TaxID=7757 RepID=A0AAJ7WK07_PETMA|nr:nuclear pore complex protein nup54-like [Petromyzon marinus]
MSDAFEDDFLRLLFGESTRPTTPSELACSAFCHGDGTGFLGNSPGRAGDGAVFAPFDPPPLSAAAAAASVQQQQQQHHQQQQQQQQHHQQQQQ